MASWSSRKVNWDQGDNMPGRSSGLTRRSGKYRSVSEPEMVARVRNSPMMTQQQVQIKDARTQMKMQLKHSCDVAVVAVWPQLKSVASLVKVVQDFTFSFFVTILSSNEADLGLNLPNFLTQPTISSEGRCRPGPDTAHKAVLMSSHS